MPKLSREKKQSIRDTFAKNKQYKTTAKIERVDPRTVKSVVGSQSKAYDRTSQSTSNTSARARVNFAGESTQLGFQGVNSELFTNVPLDARFLQDFGQLKQDVRIIKRILIRLTKSEVVTRRRVSNKVRHWPLDKNSGFKGRGLGRPMNSDHPAAAFLAAMKRHPDLFC